MGVIGLGGIGRAVATRLSHEAGMRVIGTRPSVWLAIQPRCCAVCGRVKH